MKKSITLMMTLLFAMAINAQTFDKTDQLNGVHLKSGKKEDVRVYVGSVQRSLPYPIASVRKAVTTFTEQCNNDYKDKRKYSSKDTDCKYLNENMVESFIVKDIKPLEQFQGLSEFYLIGRQVYNRGSFGFYELLTIREGVNQAKQKTVTVTLKMLNDKEVKQLATPRFSKESAFDNSLAVFTLTELSPTQTHMNYEYTTDTDHWILNKEVSVPQVFASISKGINDIVNTVETESSLQKRVLASQE